MEEDGNRNAPLVEGEDYYLENGLMVFTARYHLRRGYCCDSNCRHCPYKQEPTTGEIGALFKNVLGLTGKCESCGEPFVCGASLKGCWCTDVEVTESTRQTLRDKFANCVCRTCLEKAERATRTPAEIDE